MPESKLFLHDHPASSYAQKVRLALREKGIPFDKATPEGLGAGLPIPSLASANPRQEVPALVDGDFKIFDSKVILAYLEDKYPEKPLLPKDAKARATARLIEEVCDSQYEALNWGVMEVRASERATGELADKLLSNAKNQLAEIHAWLSSYLGDSDYFNGDSYGYADLVVVPYINRSFVYNMMPSEDHPLSRWRARVLEKPSVKQTFEEMQEATKQMSSVFRDLFKPGTGRRREYRDHRLEWMIKSGGIDIVQKGIDEGTVRFSWPGGI